MPRKLELEALEVELASLSALLDEAKEVQDAVGVIQYEQRKHELEKEIAALRQADQRYASIALYFGGRPVFGSRGIASDFAGRALENFQEIVSKSFAKTELGSLGERGRVPLRDNTTLMVTGITHGSFGFVLDELSTQTEIYDTALKEVVTEVSRLIESAGSTNEIDFESVAENLDARTLIALRDFFADLDSSAATIRLVDDVRDFFLDESAILRARIRTEATQIDEVDEELTGILLGFLPDHRRFELQDALGNTIYGSATKQSTEQYVRTIHLGAPAIGRRCIAKVRVRTVRPLNRPPRLVYRLLEFVEIGGDGVQPRD